MDESTYFIPYYIGTIDQVGHLYGNDIDSIRPHLQKVDKLLSEIFNLCRSRDYSFAVLGDHGMIPITQKINIMEEVQNCLVNICAIMKYFMIQRLQDFGFITKMLA